VNCAPQLLLRRGKDTADSSWAVENGIKRARLAAVCLRSCGVTVGKSFRESRAALNTRGLQWETRSRPPFDAEKNLRRYVAVVSALSVPLAAVAIANVVMGDWTWSLLAIALQAAWCWSRIAR
jgi:hypothetical protein